MLDPTEYTAASYHTEFYSFMKPCGPQCDMGTFWRATSYAKNYTYFHILNNGDIPEKQARRLPLITLENLAEL